MGRVLCWFGFHRWVPERWLTCDRRDQGKVCRRCYAAKETPMDKPVSERECRVCGGQGWVCENHTDMPWAGLSSAPEACNCGGAGAPCGACSLELAASGYVSLALNAFLRRAELAALEAYGCCDSPMAVSNYMRSSLGAFCAEWHAALGDTNAA